MGWVVKQWRTEAAREQAERDARRARRAADRAVAGLGAQLEALEALERLGVELRAGVQHRRMPVAGMPDALPPAGGSPAPRRIERASLRASALGELFRATDARGARAAPPAA